MFGAGAAGLGALAVTLKVGIGEWKESTRVAAQTEASIKSTGGVAGVTAKQVDGLATSLLRKSGIDDEAVKSGENMLLTFTNIRNVAGKNNDIFNQATVALTDMATKMNNGAAPSAEQMSKQAIQLGKALNDPVKGMGALRRVGVTFTDAQKDQIKAMVKSGDVMGAQKVILQELTTEFGGSAKAAGKTLPGQLNILKETFKNVAGSIVAKMVPALQSVVSWVNAHWKEISAAMKTVFQAIDRAWHGVVEPVLGALFVSGKGVVGFFGKHWPQISAAFRRVGNALHGAWIRMRPVFVALLTFAQQGVAYVREHWPQISATIARVMHEVRSVITEVVTAIVAIWRRFGGAILTILRTAFRVVKSVVTTALGNIRDAFRLIGDLIQGRWGKVWDDITSIVGRSLENVWNTIRGAAKIAWTVVTALGKTIVDGLVSALSSLVNKVRILALRALAAIVEPFSHLPRWLGGGWARDMKASLQSAIEGLVPVASSGGAAIGSAFGSSFLNSTTPYLRALVTNVQRAVSSVTSSSVSLQPGPPLVPAPQVKTPTFVPPHFGAAPTGDGGGGGGGGKKDRSADKLSKKRLAEHLAAVREANSVAEQLQRTDVLTFAASLAIKAALSKKRLAEHLAAVREANSVAEQLQRTDVLTELALLQATQDAKAAALREEKARVKAHLAHLKVLHKEHAAALRAIYVAATTRAVAAFSALSSRILSAFDAITAAFVSPAQAEINLIATRRKQEDQAQAVTDAEKALAEARKEGDPSTIAAAELTLSRLREDAPIALTAAEKALDNARTQGDPTAIAAAEIALSRAREDLPLGIIAAEKELAKVRMAPDPVAIAAAERSLARAREDIAVTSLETQAKDQQTAWDQQRAGLKTYLEDRLVTIQAHFTKEGSSWGEAMRQITSLLSDSGESFATVGAVLGKQFSNALREEIAVALFAAVSVSAAAPASVRAAAAASASSGGLFAGFDPAIATAILRRRIPQLDTGGSILSSGIAFVHRGEVVVPAAAARARGGGENTVINLTVNGWVGNDQQIAQRIKKELAAHSRANGTTLVKSLGGRR